MPKAGFCEQCNAQVWLREDGSCVNGHPAEQVSAVFEAVPAGAVQPATRPSPLPWIIAGIALIAVVALLASRPSTPTVDTNASTAAVFQAASANAQLKSCQANMRTVEGAIQTYNATNPGGELTSYDYATVMQTLVGDTLKATPSCPSGGSYSFTDSGDYSSLTCSVHGSLP
jgi:hypothetical protein